MHDQIREIFKDAGATDQEIEVIGKACVVVAEEVRNLVIDCSSIVRPELIMPLRVLFARVIHADMEKAFRQYRTEGDGACGGSSEGLDSQPH